MLRLLFLSFLVDLMLLLSGLRFGLVCDLGFLCLFIAVLVLVWFAVCDCLVCV